MTVTGTVSAPIAADRGGFVAVASTSELDRDGEVMQSGCFAPLPRSVPVHMDHVMSAAGVIGRARPFYEAGRLLVDVTFGSTADAQLARQKVLDGVLDSLSIVFRGITWKDVKGVRTLIQGELLAADLVSIPSNRQALITSARSVRRPTHPLLAEARLLCTDALLAEVKGELAASRSLLTTCRPTGIALGDTAGLSVRQITDRFLRSY